jgi:putative redox protein
MRAVSRGDEGLKQTVSVRNHSVAADEPADKGGSDTGPTPQELLAASLASCTAITMRMYAARKEWDTSGLEVEVEYEGAAKGERSIFDVTLRVPASLDDEQAQKLRVIAGKCPVHRALVGEVEVRDRLERV